MLKLPATILLVEDDPGHARLIQKNLMRSNIDKDIIVIRDGQQAMRFLFRQDEYSRPAAPTPLIVLLDLNLPGVDGYQVLKEIKQSPLTHHIPVIILTTADDQYEVQRCYDLGCNAYITKPIDYEQFSNALDKLGQFLKIITVSTRD